jgi:hypothetical protein
MTTRRLGAALGALCLVLVAGCGSGGRATPSAAPAVDATPGAVRTPPKVAQDQEFGFDEIAEFPDGIEFEMAGTVASKAESTQRGAESTDGELVTVSIRIGNGTELPYDAGRVSVTASYGDGTPAPLVLDTVGELQTGFSGSVAPSDETVAPFAFSVPFAALARVRYVVDPGDGEHEAISFTGKVERQ